MRTIKYIVLHCTAGPQTQTVAAIQNYWKNTLKWKSPGYHHLISPDGTIHDLQPIEQPSNGVEGYNSNSIHISYIGGVDKDGKATDNRTSQQEASQLHLLSKYMKMFPNAVIKGHRDFSDDKNGNGIIDPWERIKECPCFDVSDWLKKIGLEKQFRPIGIIYKLNYPRVKDSNVGKIQKALSAAGMTSKNGKPLKPDNDFGENTDHAVRAFQKLKGFPITGIVDACTQEALGIDLK